MPSKRSARKSKHSSSKPLRRERPSPGLPEICVLKVLGANPEGAMIAEPVNWEGKRHPPHIVIAENPRQPAPGVDDRVLARLKRISATMFEASVVRILPAEAAQPVIGVFQPTKTGGLIEPVSRKQKETYLVAAGDDGGAQAGQLVAGEVVPGKPAMGMTRAKVTQVLGGMDSPRAASLIAAALHDLPQVFPPEAVREAEEAPLPVPTPERADLRAVPLVTIDGEDARDFDDAVFAEPDGDGWHLIVAIADVATYVKPDSALDAEAHERGNSVYFPDRVIPMLPERLSNGLCSLVPNEDRYCMAAHLWTDTQGVMKRYRFEKAIMRSAARLTYTQVQEMNDEGQGASGGKKPSLATRHSPLATSVNNLFAAYAALCVERDRRGPLDLDLPEYKIAFGGDGNVESIAPRERLESHRLIEAYMIAANVAAADWLLEKRLPAIYRVHETPTEDKLEDLRNALKAAGYSLHVGAGVKAGHFNRVLRESDHKPEGVMVHTLVLRSQMQAYYSPENLGHFGLSLRRYCHFTSPIRRYSDLVVHRALHLALDGGKNGDAAFTRLADTALHISATERRAMLAERDASDRYKAAYMNKHVGSVFSGSITGVGEFGLYVTLQKNGVTGFVPLRNLPGDFFMYDKKHSCLKGRRTGQLHALGQPLYIRVQAASALTGSLIFEPEAGKDEPQQPAMRPKRPHGKPKRREDKSKPKKKPRR